MTHISVYVYADDEQMCIRRKFRPSEWTPELTRAVYRVRVGEFDAMAEHTFANRPLVWMNGVLCYVSPEFYALNPETSTDWKEWSGGGYQKTLRITRPTV